MPCESLMVQLLILSTCATLRSLSHCTVWDLATSLTSGGFVQKWWPAYWQVSILVCTIILERTSGSNLDLMGRRRKLGFNLTAGALHPRRQRDKHKALLRHHVISVSWFAARAFCISWHLIRVASFLILVKIMSLPTFSDCLAFRIYWRHLQYKTPRSWESKALNSQNNSFNSLGIVVSSKWFVVYW